MKKRIDVEVTVSDIFTKREIDVLTRYLDGERIEEIARSYNVTPERICQVFGKIYKKLTADKEDE